jgi:glycosyltransferase involved in cell wall biosynthesis
MRRPRLAVICDAIEEGWPSMDYVAEMLVKHLQQRHGDRFETIGIWPRFSAIGRRLSAGRRGLNADRGITRFIRYPASILRLRSRFDLFHIADHSYAHLAHLLPPQRLGVFCHDLDAFEPVLSHDGQQEGWRRAMARVQLRGLQRAAIVFFSTNSIGDRIRAEQFLDARKLLKAPYGIAREYWEPPTRTLRPVPQPYLLHVGGNFPRKRLDVLFDVFAEVRRNHPSLHLVQVGAKLGNTEDAHLERLGIRDRLIQLNGLSREELASIYAGSRLVLIPSEREGFGLPLLEALASGAEVLASDIPVLREVGGNAATFAPVADVQVWAGVTDRLLRGDARPLPETRRKQAERFTWEHHADVVASGYAGLLSSA